mgnify:CR=1 FL=1
MQHKQDLSYNLIGLMSGTSLDGLDICNVTFSRINNNWTHEIIHCRTITYPKNIFNKLKKSFSLSGIELLFLDKELGDFFGNSVNDFIEYYKIEKATIDAIASHGHTIFHQPDKGLTVQIGCGTSINAITGIKTINDFRKKDVVFGGQGAPLVPIGDQLLFAQFADSFLNIGGFANFSKLKNDNSITAFDICPANIVINHFTREIGQEFDRDGKIASSNEIDYSLLEKLNNIPIYKDTRPSSLGLEWVENHFYTVLNSTNTSTETNIATITEHIAIQIANRLNASESKNVFITGGGAKNLFLIERIKTHFNGTVTIPSEQTIDFKEALIFAFLGVLFLENIPNCLPSVTGARKSVVGGVLHQ